MSGFKNFFYYPVRNFFRWKVWEPISPPMLKHYYQRARFGHSHRDTWDVDHWFTKTGRDHYGYRHSSKRDFILSRVHFSQKSLYFFSSAQISRFQDLIFCNFDPPPTTHSHPFTHTPHPHRNIPQLKSVITIYIFN